VPGVSVLNATAARGLSYRALFVAGMNEGVFPRSIREDAFMRDYDREVLERDLGYKISQKLAGYDEERLIFALLASSTQERLYCSFQRSDESGRVLAPSWYLIELKRALAGAGAEQIVEHTFPRSLEHKAASKPFDREDLLLPEELAIRLSLSGKDAQSLIEQADLSPHLFEQGLRTIERIDLSTERLHDFDGMIAAPAEYWQHVSERGLSPTALELYARCPFQYFARQVLGLERLETPETALGPSLAEFGELGHLILKLTYQDLIRRGHFSSRLSAATIDTILIAAAESAFKEYEAYHPIGYPLIWETLRETLTELIRNVLTLDLKELAESGYLPADFESEITDKMPADWPEPLNGLTIRGRMDRIDIDQARNRTRVVDYKFKFGSKPSPEDNNLCRAALRAERLQPPFYSLLGKTLRRRVDPQSADTEIGASFYYIASRWNEGPLLTRTFDASQLTGTIGEEIKATIAQLARGIQAGNFFLQKGEHCRYCEVAEICRKNHPPSLWRAENDAGTAAHRHLRDKDIKTK
jgi:ATP-dependent helicase/nuclease subunit B